MSNPQIRYSLKRVEKYLDTPDYVPTPDPSLKKLDRLPHYTTFPFRKDNKGTKTFLCILAAALFLFLNGKRFRNLYNENKVFLKLHLKSCNMFSFHYSFACCNYSHYEKKLTKNIRPTDILQIYTSI